MDIQSNPKLYAIRHSLAHVLAQAVELEFPNVKLGFGPPTETGFYYDFDFGDQKISEKDFEKIERRMRRIIQEKQQFSREDLTFEEALARSEKQAQPYKVENIKTLHSRGETNFSFYKNGPFEDLCEGPHVSQTGELPQAAFKLDRVAGAYWLGNEKNKMLTRIYVLAFETEVALKEFLKRRENAENFDHKKLGKELGLFHFDDMIGKGLPLWLPNGTIIRDQIENYAKEMEFKAGYKRVSTPILAKRELYLTSQHLPAYEESMFPPMVCTHADTGYEEQYYLRPMNCPHHHLVYKSSPRSYRELPLRLAEYGTTFRYEQSGELSGLLRVRGMTLNDAHIYARLDQVADEIVALLKLYMEIYETFKLTEYSFRLSLRDPNNTTKYKGDAEMWDKAEELLTKVLDQSGISYFKAVGEGAFYGPKIDIQFKNLLGREETVSTIQVDFLGPKNFDLTYVDEAGQEQRPVVLHRAPLSTHERFISYLIEYYGGAFPTWLAPVQVAIIPVGEAFENYCAQLEKELHAKMVRVTVDTTANSFNKKIKVNTERKIPIILIVGNNEVTNNSVTVRRYGVREQETLSKETFVGQLLEEIQERKNFRTPLSAII